MTKSYTSAMEGIFDPEATVDSLLATVKENITSNVTSVDQAADLENRLSEEAAEFNSMLATISTAMRQCEAGEITKEEALAAAKPCVDALKERCEALKLGGVDVKDDDITENEIAMLREYIVGCKDIVAAHKETLQGCPITQNEENSEEASEGVLSYLGNLDVANEASLAMSVRNSNDAKNATALYKNAKKLYAMGSKDKAKTYMQQAKAKYQKCLEAAKKTGKPHKIERTVGTVAGGSGSSTFYKDKDSNYTTYAVPGMAYVVRYFEDRVDTCEAYLRQWANKAGNKDLQETKEMLKKERQEEKARIRAERKAASEAAYLEFLETSEFIDVCESLMDGYEMDLAMEASLEALNEDTDLIATEAAANASSIRESCSKMRNAKNQQEFEAAKKEAADSMKNLGDDIDNEKDPEKKKKLSIGAKIAIAAGAALLAVAGITLGGQLVQKGKDLNIEGSAAAKLLAKMSNAIMRVPFKAVQKYNEVRASYVKGGVKLDKMKDGETIQDYHSRINKIRYNLQDKADHGILSADGQNRLNKAKQKQLAINKQEEYLNKAAAAGARAAQYQSFGKTGQILKDAAKNTADDAAYAAGKFVGKVQSAANTVKDAAKNSVDAGKAAFNAGKTAPAPQATPVEQLKSKYDWARAIKAKKADYRNVPKAMRDEVRALLKQAGINVAAKATPSLNSFTELDGTNFLATLAMEEANFTDDVPLTEIENEEGRGFDDEAQGEDLTDEAIVGVDDLDDEDEVEESVLESTLSVMMLEDGLDPDED